MFDLTKFPLPALISVNGIILEIFESGQHNAGNPIALCHGCYQIPALVEAGYHVIVPNQRGYGNSSYPSDITDYDLALFCVCLFNMKDWPGLFRTCTKHKMIDM